MGYRVVVAYDVFGVNQPLHDFLGNLGEEITESLQYADPNFAAKVRPALVEQLNDFLRECQGRLIGKGRLGGDDRDLPDDHLDVVMKR